MYYSIEELEKHLGDISNKEIKYLKIENVTNDINKSIRKYIDNMGYAYYSQYEEVVKITEELILKDIEREYTYWTLFKHQFKDLLTIKNISKETLKNEYSITKERFNFENGHLLKLSTICAIANDIDLLYGEQVTVSNLKSIFNIEFLDETIEVNDNYSINKNFHPVKYFNNPILFLYKTYSYTGGKDGYNCHYLDYKLIIV